MHSRSNAAQRIHSSLRQSEIGVVVFVSCTSRRSKSAIRVVKRRRHGSRPTSLAFFERRAHDFGVHFWYASCCLRVFHNFGPVFKKRPTMAMFDCRVYWYLKRIQFYSIILISFNGCLDSFSSVEGSLSRPPQFDTSWIRRRCMYEDVFNMILVGLWLTALRRWGRNQMPAYFLMRP